MSDERAREAPEGSPPARRVRRRTAGVRYRMTEPKNPRRHLRLLWHPRRLGGRRRSFLYQLGCATRTPSWTAARSCATVGRRSSSASPGAVATVPGGPGPQPGGFCEERGFPYRKKEGEALSCARCAPGSRSPTRARAPPGEGRGLAPGHPLQYRRDIMAHSCVSSTCRSTTSSRPRTYGAYKPSTRLRVPLSRIDEAPDHILHVAFGFKYDIAPAQRPGHANGLGQPPRRGGARAERADHEWRDLGGWPSWSARPARTSAAEHRRRAEVRTATGRRRSR